MRVPKLDAEVERRLLVNYRVDPEVAASHLPEPFLPQLHNGYALAGICLIRLGRVRPAGLPGMIGLRSENAAHRFAVHWTDADGRAREGVYIPRRDTDSMLNVAVGGRIFPGEHHRARFDVQEGPEALRVGFDALDGSARVTVEVEVAADLGGSVVFDSLADASAFFERGALGFSATGQKGVFDGLRLHTDAWRVEPVRVTRAESSYFDDPARFPTGSAVLDNALLMRRVPVQWRAENQLRHGESLNAPGRAAAR